MVGWVSLSGGRAAFTVVLACIAALAFGGSAAAETRSTSVLDGDDVQLGDGSADLRAVELTHDGSTLGVTIRLRQTGAQSKDQAIFVWLDPNEDGRANWLVRVVRPSSDPANATYELLEVAPSAPGCAPTDGAVKATGTAPADSGNEEVTIGLSVPLSGFESFLWAAYAFGVGTEGEGSDYAPGAADPTPEAGATGSRDCDIDGGAGKALVLDHAEGFPLTPPRFLYGTVFIDDVRVPGFEIPTPQEGLADVNNAAPTAKIAVKGKPRAGKRILLDAGRSGDTDGNVTEYRWELDGNGDFGDAFGPRIPFIPSGGKQKIAVSVVDDKGREATREITVRSSGSPVRGLDKTVARAPSVAKLAGAGLQKWSRVGDAFRGKVSTATTLPASRVLETEGTIGGDYASIPVPVSYGGRWISSYRPPKGAGGLTSDTAGDMAVGALVSPKFTVKKKTLAYQLGGQADPGNKKAERVEVWAGRRGRPLRPVRRLTRYVGASEPMGVVVLNAAGLLGHQAVLVAVDASSIGRILFGQPSIVPDDHAFGRGPQRGTPQNFQDPVDTTPAPIVGWADLHTHPMAQMAHGAMQSTRTYFGVAGRDYELYQRDPAACRADVLPDSAKHGGGPASKAFIDGIETGNKPGIAAAFGSVIYTEPPGLTTVANEHGGDVGGPAHQQMHITEIRRAWEGGQRMMSALAVNSAAAEFFMSKTARLGACCGIRATPDRLTIESQVEGIRQLAAANASWMQVVYSPEQAGEVMRAGKLALVLGVEVAELDTVLGAGRSPQEVADYLWGLGVRQVIPVHAIDNGIGGAALFQDGYASAQDLSRRPFFGAHATDVSIAHTEGLSVDQASDFTDRSRQHFGFFQRPERHGCSQGVPRGECVDWWFNEKQNILYEHNFLGTALPFASEFTSTRYRQLKGVGQRNSLGLTSWGRDFLRALMGRGILVDVEHMSDRMLASLTAPGGPVWFGVPGCDYRRLEPLSVEGTATDCFRGAYPLISSHTSFRAQSQPGSILGADPSEIAKSWVAREFERAPADIEYIRRSGGIIGSMIAQDPIVPLSDVPTVPSATSADWRFIQGRDRPLTSNVRSTCQMTSESWATAYLYGISKMRGAGVALSTDMALIRTALPRFKSASGNECPFDGKSILPTGGISERPVLYARPVEREAGRVRQHRTPVGTLRDFNVEGLASYGLLPDLLQDARNVGVSASDLAPLMSSAQSYLDTWNRAYRVNGCGADPRASGYSRCGARPTISPAAGACNNACPNDEGRGFARHPDGTEIRKVFDRTASP